MKYIPGYEGLYTINTSGVIKNKHNRIMKTYMNPDGYERITLVKSGKRKGHYVHLLLADTYIKKQQGTSQIDHINRERNDNSLKNLRRVSPKENSANRG